MQNMRTEEVRFQWDEEREHGCNDWELERIPTNKKLLNNMKEWNPVNERIILNPVWCNLNVIYLF